ncbi:small ribosomal subunit protein bS6m [Hydra vulgaris]|uniref:Small ribosomal subunit protein bS6m n=1 Tax=Hydra vulgaris TaxID=6087 RepID=T2MED5_HYDVU|nr:28S ribosomal protein S6, mitochondrial-like [Hydra vulgaris]
MPRYELLLITRALERPQLKIVLQRTAANLFQQEAIIRKIESMGQQELPYRMKSNSVWHTHGNYFLFDAYIKLDKLPFIRKELSFDSDIIRQTFIKKLCDFDEEKARIPKIYECTTSYVLPYEDRKRN